MIHCRVCERSIRVAAVEEYDETTQTMKYTCKKCWAFFLRLTRRDSRHPA
jgi:hypothetical protein